MYRALLKGAVWALLIACLAGPALGDWEPGDGHKMHFPQLPDELGYDVNATVPMILADDWECSQSGWVKDIHFWGSWREGLEGEIEFFVLSIHGNVPGQPNLPGEVLWEMEVSDFQVVAIDPAPTEHWYDPRTGELLMGDHEAYFQYNVLLPRHRWFWQEQGPVSYTHLRAHET